MLYSFFDKGTSKISFARELPPPLDYRSFATTNANLGCNDGPKGQKQWGGQTTTGMGFGIGKDCTAARNDFCSKFGKTCKNGKKICYGEICPGETSGGSGNSFKGLQDAGLQIAKTDPGKGITVFDSGNKGSGNGSNNNGEGCQWYDVLCALKGLNLPPSPIPGVPTEWLVVGGLGTVLLILLLKR